MTYSIKYESPALRNRETGYTGLSTKKEARAALSDIYNNYRRSYGKGQGFRDKVYFTSEGLVAHDINNDGSVSGDRLFYKIVKD